LSYARLAKVTFFITALQILRYTYFLISGDLFQSFPKVYRKIMNIKRSKLLLLILSSLYTAFLLAGCGSNTHTDSLMETETGRPDGWTEETHSNDADPNYEVVFPQKKVNQIVITIEPDDWDAMQTEMVEMYGEKGTGPAGPGNMRPGRFLPDEQLPDSENFTPFPRPDLEKNFPEDGGDLPRDPNAGDLPGWVDMTSTNPSWVTATIEFNGLTWTNVGIRYKGNSSLTSAWRSGSLKIPFKLDFDEFEDDYPEIDNQRFYGFKQLSFSNAFADGTYMRDALAANILDESGLVAAETAWYEVILDYGEGQVDLGLYVAIEVIDDTVIDHYFEEDSGNIYEGDGRGVSLAEGTLGQIKGSFLKENNTKEADWSDIEELYKVLHSDNSISDPEKWEKDLEEIFDVDDFLKWLAISAVIQHWDTYGSMTHNFYLYNDPESGQLTWISWDHNQVLAGEGPAGNRGGRPVEGILPGRTISLSRNEVTDQWPLIRYLLDDPVYSNKYLDYMAEMLNEVFIPEQLEKKCRDMVEVISPYLKDDEKNSFTLAVEELIDRIYERYQATLDFLKAEE
jgi:spore coat protein H